MKKLLMVIMSTCLLFGCNKNLDKERKAMLLRCSKRDLPEALKRPEGVQFSDSLEMYEYYYDTAIKRMCFSALGSFLSKNHYGVLERGTYEVNYLYNDSDTTSADDSKAQLLLLRIDNQVAIDKSEYYGYYLAAAQNKVSGDDAWAAAADQYFKDALASTTEQITKDEIKLGYNAVDHISDKNRKTKMLVDFSAKREELASRIDSAAAAIALPIQ